MKISLTPRAAQQVLNYLADRGRGLGIRILVQSSECSGMTYHLEFVDQVDDSDEAFVSHGARIFVDQKSLVWLDGTEIDYLEIGEESGFSFRNPNIKDQCSCGESFYV